LSLNNNEQDGSKSSKKGMPGELAGGEVPKKSQVQTRALARVDSYSHN